MKFVSAALMIVFLAGCAASPKNSQTDTSSEPLLTKNKTDIWSCTLVRNEGPSYFGKVMQTQIDAEKSAKDACTSKEKLDKNCMVPHAASTSCSFNSKTI